VYFSVKYASKLIERFPSLIHIELRVFSLSICVSIVDSLLSGLAKLHHLKIYYDKYVSFDVPCPVNYVREKRRQAFPLSINDIDGIVVNINQQFVEIYLTSCLICANKTYDI
jgi:hypothetical protein